MNNDFIIISLWEGVLILEFVVQHLNYQLTQENNCRVHFCSCKPEGRPITPHSNCVRPKYWRRGAPLLEEGEASNGQWRSSWFCPGNLKGRTRDAIIYFDNWELKSVAQSYPVIRAQPRDYKYASSLFSSLGFRRPRGELSLSFWNSKP